MWIVWAMTAKPFILLFVTKSRKWKNKSYYTFRIFVYRLIYDFILVFPRIMLCYDKIIGHSSVEDKENI